MFASQAHSFSQQSRLALSLAWVAGYTNILTILTCGTVTSHMTGTASNLGRDVAEGSWPAAGFMLFILALFVLGAAVSGLVTETGRRRGWQSIYVLPITIQASLLSLFALGIELHETEGIVTGSTLWQLTGLAAAAMGLQNATITRISGGVIRTTHLTGVLTDLGSESVQLLYDLKDRRADGSLRASGIGRVLKAHPLARHVLLLGCIVGAFALGAGLGTLAHDSFPRWSMTPPVALLLWIIVMDIRAPICEIERSGLFGEQHGLPESIAVYHLKRGRHRRGKVHRLPDLLRWAERLPRAARVMILDLEELTELNDNAALELRSLAARLAASGRTLILAGVTQAQYRTILAARADDLLQPANVCPDLELAIARGLVVLESRD